MRYAQRTLHFDVLLIRKKGTDSEVSPRISQALDSGRDAGIQSHGR